VLFCCTSQLLAVKTVSCIVCARQGCPLGDDEASLTAPVHDAKADSRTREWRYFLTFLYSNGSIIFLTERSTVDYLAELADEYLRGDKLVAALPKELPTIQGTPPAQMVREKTISVLHEVPQLAAETAKTLSFYPLFIQRLADDVIDRLKSQSRPLRLRLDLTGFTDWLWSDDPSTDDKWERMAKLVEELEGSGHDRRELLDLRNILTAKGPGVLEKCKFNRKNFYEFLADPDKLRSDFRPRLMDLLLSCPKVVVNLAKLTHAAVPFTLVLKRELEEITTMHRACQAAPADKPSSDETGGESYPLWDALRKDLVGLALSGGGIRSATFNLGVLQGLAELKLLSQIDYMSTVSGGGYIGAWLVGRIYHGKQKVQDVEKLLSMKDSPNPTLADAHPVQFLREYSNYLTPQTGFFSADTWTMGVTWLRNTLLNQLILVIALAGLLLIPRFAYWLTFPARGTRAIWVAGGLLVLSARCIWTNLRLLNRDPTATVGGSPPRMGRWSAQAQIQSFGVLALLAFAWLAITRLSSVVYDPPGWVMPDWFFAQRADSERNLALLCVLFGALCFLVLGAVGVLGGYEKCLRERDVQGDRAQKLVVHLVLPIGSALTGTFAAGMLWGVAIFYGQIVRQIPGRWMPAWFFAHGSESERRVALGLVLVGLLLWLLGVGMAVVTELCKRFSQRNAPGTSRKARPLWKHAGFVGLIFIVVGFISWVLWQILNFVANWRAIARFFPDSGVTVRSCAIAGALIWVLLWFTGNYTGLAQDYWFAGENGKVFSKKVLMYSMLAIASGLAAAAAAGLLWLVGRTFFAQFPRLSGEWHVLTFGPPLLILLISLAVVLHMGLLGPKLLDDHREWWSRFIAWCMIYSLAWLSLFAVAIYAPLLYASLMVTTRQWAFSGLSATWLIATAVGVLAARSPQSGHSPSDAESEGLGSAIVRGATVAAPYVFIAGLLAAISVSLEHLLRLILLGGAPDWNRIFTEYWLDMETIQKTLGGWLWLIALGCIALSYFLSTRVDVNEFSMHNFYRNRLVRCYLGASRSGRKPDTFVGFDPDDDILLKDLSESTKKYTGPYPILNTSLNLVGGGELAWQERKAASFIFTPLYCGYDARQTSVALGPGSNVEPEAYRPTGQYAYPDRGPYLGTAMGISGAAASPNSGSFTSAASSFLMTVFNARLGWWIGNPRYKGRPWQSSGPGPLGLFYLLNELTGGTNDKSWYVNLSDGGHFENLGVYELVRRRCRYIIVCDAGQDRAFALEDLGNAIRKCRVDFGVEIEMRLDQIRDRDSSRRSRAHCVVGTIRYPNAPDDVGESWLIYLKSSITGDEDFDVLEYARRVPAFPHESTADQWFNESQFESYRMLGYDILRSSFQPLGRNLSRVPARKLISAINLKCNG